VRWCERKSKFCRIDNIYLLKVHGVTGIEIRRYSKTPTVLPQHKLQTLYHFQWRGANSDDGVETQVTITSRTL
jgi:hypothetical protein